MVKFPYVLKVAQLAMTFSVGCRRGNKTKTYQTREDWATKIGAAHGGPLGTVIVKRSSCSTLSMSRESALRGSFSTDSSINKVFQFDCVLFRPNLREVGDEKNLLPGSCLDAVSRHDAYAGDGAVGDHRSCRHGCHLPV